MAEKHITDAIVVHCIDFRFQKYINNWISENIGEENYDRLSIAGSVFDFETVFKQVQLSGRLHEIKKAIFINHEDCGAYGTEGNKERHAADLCAAREGLDERCARDLAVELYYLHLDGEFERVS
ncbi:MAG: hypothetical protein HN855_00370 [Anaerolineae bacterium]|nr:hypothetical protein [Anaerolineae bacterium]MBT7070066.1 hypothetical protein [Anaerolineae bacterium]MBT7323595.1 hypothetical protein [Anaerolineae bacterium]